MEYNQAINYIHSIPKFSRVLGNDMLRALLKRMGNPEQGQTFVHIGGTNGKGSISTMISEILISSGYRVGLFTSPYLVRFNERIRINRVPINDDELGELVEYVKEISERYDAEVSEFAFDTALALEYFKRESCDFSILEVGLGGRLDATNVIETPIAVGITSIGLDHCQYLGNTIEKIADEKLAIIKHGCGTVVYPIQEKPIFDKAKKVCAEKNSSLHIPNISRLEVLDKTNNVFLYKNEEYRLNMFGEFQVYNALTAIELAETIKAFGYKIGTESIKSGLHRAKIDGRLERLNSNLIIDGAHNPQAVSALLDALDNENRHICFLTAVMEDKDYKTMAQKISEFAMKHNSEVFATQIDMPRCLSAEKLKDEFTGFGTDAKKFESLDDAIKSLEKRLRDAAETLFCVCGSLYLAGYVKKNFENRLNKS